MTTKEHFLSKRQRYQPISLPQHFSDEEVARDWTLLERDRHEIERYRKDVCFARKVGHFANKIGRLAFQSRKEASARSVGRRKQPGMIGVYNTSPSLRDVSHRPKSRRCHKDWPFLSVRLAARSSITRFLSPKICGESLCPHGQRRWQICAPRPSLLATGSRQAIPQTGGKFLYLLSLEVFMPAANL